MSADALLPASKDSAALKFHTVFNGLTIGPNIYAYPRVYNRPITGTDAITGYNCTTDIQSFFGSSAKLQIQALNEDTTITADSITSIAIPNTFPTPISMTWDTNKSFAVNDEVIISSASAPGTNYMIGTVTGYTAVTGAANIDITSKAGSGTIANWKVSAIPKQLESSILPSTLSSRPGANDVYLQQHYRVSAVGSNFYPQHFVMIERPGNATRPDVEECLISFIIELPTNLAAMMDYTSRANYYIFFDWKTDGYLSQAYGDYRIVLGILRDGNGMKYRFRADNSANGEADVPSVGSAYVPFWLNSDVYNNVELGVPTRFDIYIKRPKKIFVRSPVTVTTASGPRYELDTSTGISAAARTNMNTGVSTLIHKQIGGQQMGNENLPFGRLFHGSYCVGSDGSDPVVWSRISEFMVYDSIPSSRKHLFNL